MRSWLPTWGWKTLRDEELGVFDLDVHYMWRIWSIEWFGEGIALKLERLGPNPRFDAREAG